MLALWAVLRREVEERRQVLWLGFFLGLLCPIVAYLPLGFRARPNEVRDVLVIGVTAGFFGLFSLLIGLGLFASDQAAGRMGFYLSRPVRPWHLLVGRVTASLVVVLLGSALVALPTLLVSGRLWRGLDGGALLAAALGSILALCLAHAAAVALRLRGRWTLLDLGALAGLTLLVGSSLQQAALNQLSAIPEVLALLLGVTVIIAAFIGIWTQLRYGGTQRGRLHAVFTLAFWSLILLVAGYYDVQQRTALARDWDDLQSFALVMPSNDGSAVWLTATEGLVRPLSYVLDLERGRRIPVETAQWATARPLVQDRTVIWPQCELQRLRSRRSRASTCGLVRLDLDSESPGPVSLAIAGSRRGGFDRHLLTPGSEQMWMVADQLTLYSLVENRPVQTLDTPGAVGLIGFSTNGEPLVLRRSGEVSKLAAVSPDGTLRPLGSTTEPGPAFEAFSRDGFRWAVSTEVPSSCMEFAPPEHWLESCGWRMVGPWRVWIRSDEGRLYAMAPDGREIDPILLPLAGTTGSSTSPQPNSRHLLLGPEAEPDRLMVVSARFWWPNSKWNRMGLLVANQSLPFWTFSRGRVPWREESWTTTYVDLETSRVLASFDGFQAVRRQIEGPAGPEAWLLDQRGLPHRFHPDRLDPQNPMSSLEPVFAPPWRDDRSLDDKP